jgi:hypothetical protein
MWRKYKNWVRLIRFIRKHRKNGLASFEIVTNSEKLIIYPSGTERTFDNKLKITNLNL